MNKLLLAFSLFFIIGCGDKKTKTIKFPKLFCVSYDHHTIKGAYYQDWWINIKTIEEIEGMLVVEGDMLCAYSSFGTLFNSKPRMLFPKDNSTFRPSIKAYILPYIGFGYDNYKQNSQEEKKIIKRLRKEFYNLRPNMSDHQYMDWIRQDMDLATKTTNLSYKYDWVSQRCQVASY